MKYLTMLALVLSAAQAYADAPYSNSQRRVGAPVNAPLALNANPNVATADDEIIYKIRLGIKNDNTLSDLAKSTQVSSADGKVTLLGTVATNDEKRRLENLAKQVTGVKSVTNKLEVEKKY